MALGDERTAPERDADGRRCVGPDAGGRHVPELVEEQREWRTQPQLQRQRVDCRDLLDDLAEEELPGVRADREVSRCLVRVYRRRGAVRRRGTRVVQGVRVHGEGDSELVGLLDEVSEVAVDAGVPRVHGDEGGVGQRLGHRRLADGCEAEEAVRRDSRDGGHGREG